MESRRKALNIIFFILVIIIFLTMLYMFCTGNSFQIMKAVVVEVDENFLSVMDEDTNMYIIKYNDNSNIDFKQEQEILIFWIERKNN